MIRFDNVWKEYRRHNFRKLVFREVSFTIRRGDALGICGANGAGKSTLIRLLAGVEKPSYGVIERNMTTSWPLGYQNAFQTSLTGADNARFVARVYDRPVEPLLDYVESFAGLGPYLHQPMNTYSAGMNARFAFAVSLAIEFDCYLIDEATAAGDARFRYRFEQALLERKERGSLVMVSHSTGTLRTYCDRGAVLLDGRLTLFETIDEAIAVHESNQARG